MEHEVNVKNALNGLWDPGLQVDVTKSQFHFTEIDYLELIVTTKKVRMDLTKVNTILNLPTLRNVKEIQSFFGFTHFYFCFIYGFSRLATPLTELTKKNVRFALDDKYEQTFIIFKKAFTSLPILSHFNPDRKTFVETDTLYYVSRGIFYSIMRMTFYKGLHIFLKSIFPQSTAVEFMIKS